jgi:hypothetical protein
MDSNYIVPGGDSTVIGNIDYGQPPSTNTNWDALIGQIEYAPKPYEPGGPWTEGSENEYLDWWNDPYNWWNSEWGAYPGDIDPIETYEPAPPGGMTGIIGSELDTPQTEPDPMAPATAPMYPPNHGIIQPGTGGGILGSGVELNLGGLIPIGAVASSMASIIGSMSGGTGMGPQPSQPSQEQNPTLNLPPPIMGPQPSQPSGEQNPTLGLPVPISGPQQNNPPPSDNPTLNLPVPLPYPNQPPTAIGNMDTVINQPRDNEPTQVPVVPIGGGGQTPPGGTTPNDAPPTTNIPVIIPPVGGGGQTPPPTSPPPVANNLNFNLQVPQSSPIAIADPTARNLLNEGGVSNTALSQVAPGALGNYSANSGLPGQSDIANFMSLLGQMGFYNNNLTGQASQQTAASNSALRQGNLQDVSNMAPQALAMRMQANPELYSMLGQYGASASQMLQQDMGRQGGQLTPGEVRNSQQAAREAYASRGRLNDNTAIAGEVLSRDAMVRQREQQNRGYLQQSMQNAYGAIGAQSANAFDPFGAILGAQYGMQTSNMGNNNALYQQGVGFSSGQNSNQYVQQLTNPLGAYPSDVYGSNFNMENARRIAESNNAAAAQGARTAGNYALAGAALGNANELVSAGKSIWDLFK